MAHIKPFRAYCYNTDRVRLDDVVAPPYDVISQIQRDELYRRNDFNSIKLILGRGKDPYREAGDFFNEWKSDGVLVRDQVPAMYLVAQNFRKLDGSEVVRTGVIAAFRLEELGAASVFPHERTLSTPKEDRMKLLSATRAMFSQIFGLYADPAHLIDRLLAEAMRGDPDLHAVYEGVENSLWKIADQNLLLQIQTAMAERKVLIADGHHRYETALAYAAGRRAEHPGHTGKESYNFVPMYLTNLHNPGIAVLATHRMVHGIPGFTPENFLKSVPASFAVQSLGSMDDLLARIARPSDPPLIGLILRDEQMFYLLRPSGRQLTGAKKYSSAIDMIDVVLLERIIFTAQLGMTEKDIQTKRFIEYEKDADECLAAVREGAAQAAFLLQPPHLERIKAVAEAGFVLPQKSTYFYPKLLSGTVIYSFSDDE
jgi:uncharacterized protein (DUF1015 family)